MESRDRRRDTEDSNVPQEESSSDGPEAPADEGGDAPAATEGGVLRNDQGPGGQVAS